MKYFKTLLAFVFIFIFGLTASLAQYYYVSDPFSRVSSNTYFSSTNTFRLVFNSDPSTKSVLVSNVIADKAGVLSPILGAATWTDNGKELFCRSFLEFDFNLLPIEVRQNPSLIKSAELVLYPINIDFEANGKEKPSFFYVRQVLENWIDSITMWTNQPLADSIHQASFILKKENKKYPANVDVTTIVKNMIKKENNGFMLFYENSLNESLAAGQLFGSPKNIDPSIRPQLIIYFEITKRELRNLSSDIVYTRFEQPYWLYQQNLRTQRLDNSNQAPTNVIGTYSTSPGGYDQSTTTSSGGFGHGHTSTGTGTTTGTTTSTSTSNPVQTIRLGTKDQD